MLQISPISVYAIMAGTVPNACKIDYKPSPPITGCSGAHGARWMLPREAPFVMPSPLTAEVSWNAAP